MQGHGQLHWRLSSWDDFHSKGKYPLWPRTCNEFASITAINWIPITEDTTSWPKQIPDSTAQSKTQNKADRGRSVDSNITKPNTHIQNLSLLLGEKPMSYLILKLKLLIFKCVLCEIFVERRNKHWVSWLSGLTVWYKLLQKDTALSNSRLWLPVNLMSSLHVVNMATPAL